VINSLVKIYYTQFSKHPLFYSSLYRILGYCPRKLFLYKQAFVHNSATEGGLDTINSNERLEYLGDAILDLAIAELLYKKYPYQGEGFLTDMRSKSVSRKRLSEIAMQMGLQDLLFLDNSIRKNHAAIRGLCGNALEALIGAIYLDKGYPYVLKFVKKRIIGIYLDFDELKITTENFKSLLNQYAQKHKVNLEFKVLNEEEDSKIKVYKIAVVLDEKEIARARAKSKKTAQQLASEKACSILKIS